MQREVCLSSFLYEYINSHLPFLIPNPSSSSVSSGYSSKTGTRPEVTMGLGRGGGRSMFRSIKTPLDSYTVLDGKGTVFLRMGGPGF